ncbi:GDP-mannose pyrophosphorylase/mannose-1-phosphate guanylyltransferase [Klebsormidium nitens]|uniref:Glucose-1-phosphate adenylyltransferase n=1 Tax=Klebsormidium nitens TaxID=105231 RepID=A0A1Y1I1P3_KLENI|nr:GDP-mannose pyrophosphorylase/mannose-1-phosphate guanylyltransferase [Klebsormidium nitens]|eukprot:GAQ84835.1 GDP-mannose pyrophosphorylase/mannose-1-phosphate guanylyltransferase [Klebsormidium nitens]
MMATASTASHAALNAAGLASCSQTNGSRKPVGAALPQRFVGRNMAGQQVAGFWGTGIAGGEIRAEGHCRRQTRGGMPRIQATAVVADVNPAETVVRSELVNPRHVVAVILGGGAGSRLFPLTKSRAKPAVPIGGAYRLIDVPMSNCINSGITKMYILTQFNSASLNRHLAKTYLGNGATFGDGFVEVLAAHQTPSDKNWFQGTADAIRQYSWLFEDIRNRDIEDVVILSGDHLYRMDYMDFVQKHKDTGADITISVVPMDDSRASDFGLVKIDATGRITSFVEKPKGEDLKAAAVDTTILGLDKETAKAKPYIASMGIYVFKKEVLLKLLRWRFPNSNDFGGEIIPQSTEEHNVQAYLFKDYWEDIGTIKSFFDANLALTDSPPQFKFYDAQKPIYTSPRFLPPTSMEKCSITTSIISHGCFLRECKVEHSIVGIRARLEKGADLKDVLYIGADEYETDAERAGILANGGVPIGIGENTVIRNAIIDKNARIGKNCVITNKDGVMESDHSKDGYMIRSGIVVILRESKIADGTHI